jgi:hydrogenase maturation protein HypF
MNAQTRQILEKPAWPEGGAPAALRLRVLGRVQGVGFRPFVARIAWACRLAGWVKNTPEGVAIHLEGAPEDLAEFRARLCREAPAAAEIHQVHDQAADPLFDRGFQVLDSDAMGGAILVAITPDLAVCRRCLAEFLDPTDRRFGYALSGCTDCGPRFTHQTAPPFDRDRTTMAAFAPCPDCLREYATPSDRRFHAQNVACARCGPRLWLEEAGGPEGTIDRSGTDRPVLAQTGQWLRDGKILAVKGIGGFHLLCDATSPEVVNHLRQKKRREGKPLAVLFADREHVDQHTLIDEAEWAALSGPAAPIVVLRRRPDSSLADEVAPGLGTVGALLAYSLLHRELVRLAGRPLVATSANASDEPMPIDNASARATLAGVADAFLLHDRPIVRPADDSLVRRIGGRAVPLRVGRGLAPVRLLVPRELPRLLATGGHLKSAVALARGREILLGQHIGDLATPAARRRYRETVDDFCRLLGVKPERIVCDRHPDYFTTRFARESGLPVAAVQHHHAHVAACLAEYGERGPALGIAWDGTGYGDDGTIWGGEFLVVDGAQSRRVGSLWPFPLVGGDRAAREPRRSAAGVYFAADESPPSGLFTEAERPLLAAALRSPRAAVTCTSAGRLFDAWAVLLGLPGITSYEAEAAIRLEDLADRREQGELPVIVVEEPGPFYRLDWRPWVAETRRLLRRGSSPANVAARFHNALARGCLEVAHEVGHGTVALSGGCFQNRFLAERVEALLALDGFRVLTHRRVPPGDGGLAVGQLWAAGFEE